MLGGGCSSKLRITDRNLMIGCFFLDAEDEMPDQKAEDFGGDKRLREQPRFLSFEKIGPPYYRTFVLFVNDVVIQRQKLRAEAG